MNGQTILGSAVIAAIVSGGISFLINRRQGVLQYITGERKEWREALRKIVASLCNASYEDTLKLLGDLKIRINALGNDGISDKYSNDSHIWKVINEVEQKSLKQEELKKKQKQLIEYISILLKYDWERSKKEVQGDICDFGVLFLLGLSGVYCVVSILYLNEENIGVYQLASMLSVYALMIIMIYSIFIIEMKTFYRDILDGSIHSTPKKYTWIRLIFCYLFVGIFVIGYIIGYSMIIKEFLKIVSCGENNAMIRLVSTYIFMPGILLWYYTKTSSMKKIYIYSNAINIIRINYEDNNNQSTEQIKGLDDGNNLELSNKDQDMILNDKNNISI